MVEKVGASNPQFQLSPQIHFSLLYGPNKTLFDICMWKATELMRTFFLDTGPLALKGIIPKEYYDNFMRIALLLNENLVKCHNKYAQDLLQCFVKQARIL